MSDDQLQHCISDDEFHILNKLQGKQHNDDTCTGHTPDVWLCQNSECGDKLTAETIGRDSESEDDGSGNTLFCTSCSSRDVRLVEHEIKKFEPKLHSHQQDVIDDLCENRNRKWCTYISLKSAGKSLMRERAKQLAEIKDKSQN
ncbi:hypothetical protein LCGC14_0425540 [marine sediment metagenome]|uniref:Uncharacterized protein n=1 Tax=marine sediment metagenome TaxID=412755 RepID=A0A0F9T7M4_9ZZZZ